MGSRRITTVFVLLGLGSSLAIAQVPLPAGVERVVLGEAERSHDPATGDSCSIPNPMPPPIVFKDGTTEISYVVNVVPGSIREVRASIEGDVGSTSTKATNCNAYTLCGGALCKSQFGQSISRADGEPLRVGSFTLVLEMVSSQSVASPPLKIDFQIK